MTRRILNTGGSANDGTGDTLREASEKINLNFQELYEITTLGGDLAESCVFDKQSPGPFHCAPPKWGTLLPKLRAYFA